MKAITWFVVAGEVVGVTMIVKGVVWGGRASAAICGIGCSLLAASAITHAVILIIH